MKKGFDRFGKALRQNGKPLFWLLLGYIPVGSGAAYVGFWLFHTWAVGFVAASMYMIGLMIIWGRILMYVRESD